MFRNIPIVSNVFHTAENLFLKDLEVYTLDSKNHMQNM